MSEEQHGRISWVQVTAAALAAVSSAFILSMLGVGGTRRSGDRQHRGQPRRQYVHPRDLSRAQAHCLGVEGWAAATGW
ncbi:MAG: hypothetical protein HZY75_12735 [Nocardioidaceae bacterium]|nr:MAG: hypothetical protein HZY75_12735 [Nocardioidaceae bacterium]